MASALATKLKRLHEDGSALDQLGRFPGWKLHPLKGDRKGFWSLTVSGNWRQIFLCDQGAKTAADIDLLGYR